MTRSDDETDVAVATEMRRQLASEPMKRFVRSLPGFALEHETPRNFNDLLGKLEKAEQRACSAPRRR